MSSSPLALIFASLFLLPIGTAYPGPKQDVLFQKSSDPHHRVKVPGQNPAFHCDDPVKDIFQIRSMRVEPNPPQGWSLLPLISLLC